MGGTLLEIKIVVTTRDDGDMPDRGREKMDSDQISADLRDMLDMKLKEWYWSGGYNYVYSEPFTA